MDLFGKRFYLAFSVTFLLKSNTIVQKFLGFWSGNLFLIAPFPDLCLLVPFFFSGKKTCRGVPFLVFNYFESSDKEIVFEINEITKRLHF